MYEKAVKWYKSLHPVWKVLAWVPLVVVVLVALVMWVAERWVRWMDLDDTRDDRRVVAEAAGEVRALEGEIERLRKHERELGERDDVLTGKLSELETKLQAARARVKGQTDEEQGDFFNNRFRG
jgi:hypothetical protein